mmetsp:Transcript_35731/g.83658  ORF Transcript_35731/g.83658 Transcript_35731/m.83658 type:complete len:209 (-) Transcript_35731:1126-1752(-)
MHTDVLQNAVSMCSTDHSNRARRLVLRSLVDNASIHCFVTRGGDCLMQAWEYISLNCEHEPCLELLCIFFLDSAGSLCCSRDSVAEEHQDTSQNTPCTKRSNGESEPSLPPETQRMQHRRTNHIDLVPRWKEHLKDHSWESQPSAYGPGNIARRRQEKSPNSAAKAVQVNIYAHTWNLNFSGRHFSGKELLASIHCKALHHPIQYGDA